ncbi:oligosaccharide flippase family protein [Modestobacter sp. I12A-02628]|uniref:Oligosaccharide flippase family protein n=1 Tax=Goekera deserti TaxID=2497753 RepID=A0A7K3WF84_9ACTN|nr:oligosaccharide flippase family protein [Goekera deserti]MPQ97913.1 oligosaccharide flippase family protein [Goekera deserti]NDI48559.1 oligosaccharide flippase family protein [Goekera deserti]NEL55062.1 oligosaccharide flippase family protein [Goekera deserti]
MAGTSLLVPVVGVFTAPILAQALGVAGRGEAAAAMAPNALVVAVATLGLPEALTYHLARRPQVTARALLFTAVISALVGLLCLVGTFFLSDYLSGGNADLADLVILGTAFAVPTLLVNLLRGAASGRQMWRAVAAERVVNSVLRLTGIAVLAALGALTVERAVLVMCVAPLVAGVAYWRLFTPSPQPPATGGRQERVERQLMSFGSRIWLGSVASILTGRLSQLLVTPLSNVEQLGLLVVAITISDVPFIVATAIRDVMFGVDSHSADAERLARTSRAATLVCLVGSAVLAVTLPSWIGVLFGREFASAAPVTVILLAAAVVNVPGLIAGAGLSAWGRPGLRSLGLVVALLTNLALFLLLVPTYGAMGAGWAALISGLAVSTYAVVATSRVLRVPALSFLVPTRADVALVRSELRPALRRLRGRRRAAGEPGPDAAEQAEPRSPQERHVGAADDDEV